MVRAFTHGAMGRWIDPSWGEPIELYVLSCLWDGAYKRTLAVNRKEPMWQQQVSSSLSEWSFTICPTPYNHKVKCVECVVK